jgi:ATP adenylyltransferase/5',5'''-P-1,P-4-tetraphosphate phosphorylase II
VGGYLLAMQISGTLLKTDAVKYFISYAIATSFYELLVKWLAMWVLSLTKKISRKTTDEDDEENNINKQSSSEPGGERPPKPPVNP